MGELRGFLEKAYNALSLQYEFAIDEIQNAELRGRVLAEHREMILEVDPVTAWYRANRTGDKELEKQALESVLAQSRTLPSRTTSQYAELFQEFALGSAEPWDRAASDVGMAYRRSLGLDEALEERCWQRLMELSPRHAYDHSFEMSRCLGRKHPARKRNAERLKLARESYAEHSPLSAFFTARAKYTDRALDKLARAQLLKKGSPDEVYSAGIYAGVYSLASDDELLEGLARELTSGKPEATKEDTLLEEGRARLLAADPAKALSRGFFTGDDALIKGALKIKYGKPMRTKKEQKELVRQTALEFLERDPAGAYAAAVILEDNALRYDAAKRWAKQNPLEAEQFAKTSIWNGMMGTVDHELQRIVARELIDKNPVRAYYLAAEAKDEELQKEALRRCLDTDLEFVLNHGGKAFAAEAYKRLMRIDHLIKGRMFPTNAPELHEPAMEMLLANVDRDPFTLYSLAKSHKDTIMRMPELGNLARQKILEQHADIERELIDLLFPEMQAVTANGQEGAEGSLPGRP